MRVYSYCSSHHAPAVKSDTENGFLGKVRKRSSGERGSSIAGIPGVILGIGSWASLVKILLTGVFQVSQDFAAQSRLGEQTYDPGIGHGPLE